MMANEQKDRRIIRSKKLIKSAFIELINEKGFETLTVRDITNKADINRGTFYLHYEDKYDLLEQLENEIIDEMNRLVKEINPKEIADFRMQDEPLPFIVKILEYIGSNSLMKFLLGSKGHSSFQMKVKELMKTNVLLKRGGEKMAIPIDYLMAYISSAHLGVIQHWLDGGQKEAPKDIAKILLEMSLFGPFSSAGFKER